MKLVHYSTQPGLKTIDPAYMGSSGVKGEESRRGAPGVARSYYYLHGTEPEKLVTSRALHKYHATVEDDKIYDIGTDFDQHVANTVRSNQGAFDPDQVLGALKDKGFHGFTNSNSPLWNAVALFHPHPVDEPTEEEVIKDIVNRLLG